MDAAIIESRLQAIYMMQTERNKGIQIMKWNGFWTVDKKYSFVVKLRYVNRNELRTHRTRVNYIVG